MDANRIKGRYRAVETQLWDRETLCIGCEFMIEFDDKKWYKKQKIHGAVVFAQQYARLVVFDRRRDHSVMPVGI